MRKYKWFGKFYLRTLCCPFTDTRAFPILLNFLQVDDIRFFSTAKVKRWLAGIHHIVQYFEKCKPNYTQPNLVRVYCFCWFSHFGMFLWKVYCRIIDATETKFTFKENIYFILRAFRKNHFPTDRFINKNLAKREEFFCSYVNKYLSVCIKKAAKK